MQFTDDEIETIKSIISEHGSDCPGTDSDKVKELEYKLGLSVRPTAEEIAERERRYKELAESPYGQSMAKLLSATNHLIPSLVADLFKENNFKIGSTLRIRMPTDFQVKKE